ncbi:hypothetical protein FRC05_002023 [Tulasnella sp. 425]|nr:hypothetical protein FRC05_002023 [Tulasnella sp. 425]
MTTPAECDWMAFLESAVDFSASSSNATQLPHAASPDMTAYGITDSDSPTTGPSGLRSTDRDHVLGTQTCQATCPHCGFEVSVDDEAIISRLSRSHARIAIDRKRKRGALDSPPTASPNPPLPSSPEATDDDKNEPTPLETRPRKKRRLLSRREQIALLTKEIEELKASLLVAEESVRKYRKYKSLYLKAKAQQTAELIPRPEGERGKKGWTLRKALQLEGKSELYLNLLASVREAITGAGLDWEKTFHKQNSARLTDCYRIIKQNNPYLERFEGDWPARELVISCMQNKRKTRNRKSKPNATSGQEQGVANAVEGDDEDSGDDAE